MLREVPVRSKRNYLLWVLILAGVTLLCTAGGLFYCRYQNILTSEQVVEDSNPSSQNISELDSLVDRDRELTEELINRQFDEEIEVLNEPPQGTESAVNELSKLNKVFSRILKPVSSILWQRQDVTILKQLWKSAKSDTERLELIRRAQALIETQDLVSMYTQLVNPLKGWLTNSRVTDLQRKWNESHSRAEREDLILEARFLNSLLARREYEFKSKDVAQFILRWDACSSTQQKMDLLDHVEEHVQFHLYLKGFTGYLWNGSQVSSLLDRWSFAQTKEERIALIVGARDLHEIVIIDKKFAEIISNMQGWITTPERVTSLTNEWAVAKSLEEKKRILDHVRDYLNDDYQNQQFELSMRKLRSFVWQREPVTDIDQRFKEAKDDAGKARLVEEAKFMQRIFPSMGFIWDSKLVADLLEQFRHADNLGRRTLWEKAGALPRRVFWFLW